MFRHTGVHRTFKHNIRLAGLLSLTAGFVNVAGFLAFYVLTTNVTGHVASFAEKLEQSDIRSALKFLLWMAMFLFGAFFSSLIIGRKRGNSRTAYTIPFIIETLILLFIGTYGCLQPITPGESSWFAGALLFAMGLQNATVSMISGSVVRTTHLTGMFTDLGIELAEVAQKRYDSKKTIRQKISLRLVIIVFFFLGGIFAGFLFPFLKFGTFFIPAGILIVAMFFDIFRIKILRYMTKNSPKS
jgi:uncharacterized membrane protein YoaK (UPF0700 family)